MTLILNIHTNLSYKMIHHLTKGSGLFSFRILNPNLTKGLRFLFNMGWNLPSFTFKDIFRIFGLALGIYWHNNLSFDIKSTQYISSPRPCGLDSMISGNSSETPPLKNYLRSSVYTAEGISFLSFENSSWVPFYVRSDISTNIMISR